jgi:hypothetical protein
MLLFKSLLIKIYPRRLRGGDEPNWGTLNAYYGKVITRPPVQLLHTNEKAKKRFIQ